MRQQLHKPSSTQSKQNSATASSESAVQDKTISIRQHNLLSTRRNQDTIRVEHQQQSATLERQANLASTLVRIQMQSS